MGIVRTVRFARIITVMMTSLLGIVLATGQSSLAGATKWVRACKPTPPDALGPFYKPNPPQRSKVGDGYVLTGVVKSAQDCSLLAGARLEFWLAGPNGSYDDGHRATTFSDEGGAYRFESNFPPSYQGRPPHIHLRVTAKGFRPLVTQHYPGAGQTKSTFDLVLIPVA